MGNPQTKELYKRNPTQKTSKSKILACFAVCAAILDFSIQIV